MGSVCRFTADGQVGTRYTLVAKEKYDSYPLLEGWHYALPLGLWYDVYTTTDLALPPPPKNLENIVARIHKAKKRRWIVLTILLIALLVAPFYPNKFDADPSW